MPHRLLCAAVASVCFCGITRVDRPRASAADPTASQITFAGAVEPILRRRCYSCHGPDKQESGLRLDQKAAALQGGDAGPALRPGKATESPLLNRVLSKNPELRMPPEGARLTAEEIGTLTAWISQGASWKEGPVAAAHWAFQPITAPRQPDVSDHTWAATPLDRFILRRLQLEQTEPSPSAPRPILIRRVYLDLLGLPPSPTQWQHWVAYPDPDWYHQMVDSLLASPHFGERGGRLWLDLARYADTDGYEKDRPRPHAYHWRDWVMDAINRDLPYDQFTEQQLAGDLLPGATEETRLATGFHRNTLTNREGGIDKEEDRVKQAVDRVNTISTVWLGLTLKCAQCHSHKYDPISHNEYYQLYGFFNNSDEVDFRLAPTSTQTEKHQQLLSVHAARIGELRTQYDAERARLLAGLPATSRQLRARYPQGAAAPPQKGLSLYASCDDANAADRGLQAAKWEGDSVPTQVAGRLGQAYQFNGKNSRWVLGRPAHFHGDQAFTIAAWIYTTQSSGSILTQLDEDAAFRGLDFTTHQGMLELHLVHQWPTNGIKVTTPALIKTNQWHQVLVRYNGSRKAAGIDIFIDGKLQKLNVQVDALTGPVASREPVRIGSRKRSSYFKGQLDDISIYDRELTDDEVTQLVDAPLLQRFLELATISPDQRTTAQTAEMVDYLVEHEPDLRKLRSQLDSLTKKPPAVETGTGMALVRATSPRRTFVHLRGDFLKPGTEVQTGVPSFLPPLAPRGAQADRLDLARWILDARNPLTSRVAVNRVWQHYFGRGLVATSDDFGTQGEPPTHPALLDWLASHFVQHEWEMKWLHRQLVTSTTYRQSSAERPDLRERDPYNLWLARQRRIRVDAEMIRDIALATSGLLDRTTHGVSVFPPLPPGTLELAFVDVINRGPWKVSTGGDRYRRGFYTFFQRTAPYPMLSLFDAPDSNTSCTRRERSNTPLQALMLWNDPVFQECAQHLALHTLQQPNATDSQRIDGLFVTTLARHPDAPERNTLTSLLAVSRRVYQKTPSLARQLLGTTDTISDSHSAEWASWFTVVRTLMNLDEFITRE
ncbi:MAG: DUF1553 domain-containing protein [Planctomycetota bacterium]|nr:DUF1553 domain-containing protein [Planctomycetota bacterium]